MDDAVLYTKTISRILKLPTGSKLTSSFITRSFLFVFFFCQIINLDSVFMSNSEYLRLIEVKIEFETECFGNMNFLFFYLKNNILVSHVA